ncbi:MAG: 3-deoxy-7-phosphoheptulonate synthase [Myxococcaceae bacterium]|nr:3-deoxy-7-phosphoheptulonate synthase [Myxococcaceae bacterium]MBH2005740.1 3-deoxy-7-phosphoheptulonate synthase [Myxococcaceae bacterium]
MMDWTPQSWRHQRIRQIPEYPNQEELQGVVSRLKTYPPIVQPRESQQLSRRLREVCEGKAFLLHGGDCAESLDRFSQSVLQANMRVLLPMATMLACAMNKPVLKIGRYAGQCAKPRSQESEIRNEISLPSYRGDLINGFEFDPLARTPDPKRMEKGYFFSAATWNILKSLTHGTEFYTSHEALLLPYEEALTHQDSSTPNAWFDGSAHFLWVGERTRQLDSAHIEFLRGISNPIGMKFSSEITGDELCQLIETLNPQNQKGRLTLIARFGHDKIAESLPSLIQAVKHSGYHVIWCCDPMHGNTQTTPRGYKTRFFQDILSEVQQFFSIHQHAGTYAGGVHVEMTGSPVIECLGGDQAITEEELGEGFYETLCDPRLNANQARELARRLILQTGHPIKPPW